MELRELLQMEDGAVDIGQRVVALHRSCYSILLKLR